MELLAPMPTIVSLTFATTRRLGWRCTDRCTRSRSMWIVATFLTGERRRRSCGGSLSGPEEWNDWLETIDLVESLEPTMIVAGHRRPDGDDHAVAEMIAHTRAYIRDFAIEFEANETAEALVDAMIAKYPHHGNLWTLQFSAITAKADISFGD
jgi:hypothetical protein